ncbi:MAG TPA: ABC transporter permease [Thermomicrobiales bacterium]|nr:ABC transporter permease [Thermomicrobiales bacterium]
MVIETRSADVLENPAGIKAWRFPGWAEVVVAVLAATLLCGVVLLLTGHDPVTAYAELIRRIMLRPSGFAESVTNAIPILITAAAVLLASRAGLWNIGIDGQVLAGAFAAAVLAPLLDGAGAGPMWLGAAFGGLVTGGLWATIPALLRARFDLNEIVSSIMLNYVALSLTAWLVKGPVRDESLVAPQTPLIPREFRLPELGGTSIHAGALVAAAIVLALRFGLARTVLGFELRAVGENPRAAWRALIPVRRVWAGAFIASGAVAALAGVNDILATKGTFQAEWNPEYGLSGFVVVFLARRSMWGIVPASLFVGALAYGADVMPRAAGIPPSFFALFEGLLLAFLAVPELFRAGIVSRLRSTGERR